MRAGSDKLVLDLLTAGVARLMTDDDIWDVLLDQWPAEDVTRLKEGFRKLPPIPRLNYARSAARWPVWSIAMGGQTVRADFLGQSGGSFLRTKSGVTSAVKRYALATDDTISIWVMSENGDATREHSILVKALLLGAGRDILKAGYDHFNFISMADLQPQPGMIPEHIFVREQNWAFVGYDATAAVFPEGYLLSTPPYVGVQGLDLGDGHVGKVEAKD